MEKPRLLVLAPRYPYPLNSGDRVRLVNVCAALASRFTITLLALCDDKKEFVAPLPADHPFAHVERIWLPRWRSALNAALAVPTSTPLQVAYYRSAAFTRRVAELLPRHDLAMSHLVRVADYLRGAPLPAVLEMTDAISLTYRRAREASPRKNLRFYIYRLEERRLLRYERRMLDHFALTSLVSPIDAAFLLDGTRNERVMVSPNGVDLAKLPFQPVFDAAPVIIFVGNLTTLPNLDACRHFCDEVMPLLRQIRPWELHMIGKMGRADAARFAERPGVRVLGEIETLAEVSRGARAGVCPMRIGAGVQNKILDYMALGLPAITSPLSLQALAAQPGEDLLVAASPRDYVTHLEALYADEQLSRRLADNGRRYVETHHAWEAQTAALRERMLALARQGAR